MTRAQPSALERRCGARQADLAVIADAVARACHRCRAVYLDTPDGRDAHQIVFGHQPGGLVTTEEEAGA